MLSEDVANIIIPLHVITSSDHTSAFFAHGKKMLQKVVSDSEARELLEQVGERLWETGVTRHENNVLYIV